MFTWFNYEIKLAIYRYIKQKGKIIAINKSISYEIHLIRKVKDADKLHDLHNYEQNEGL